MANTIRHKSESGWIVVSPVEAGTVIEVGDLLFQDAGGFALPFADSSGSSGWTEDEFKLASHIAFLGVSCDFVTGAETENTDILVATDGFFEYPTTATIANSVIGTLVGSVDDAFGVPLSQQVQIVANTNQSIGVVYKPVAIGDTRIHCRLISSVMWGGVQDVI